MGVISPRVAAELAGTIYDVQDEFLLKAFINKHSVFSKKTGDTQHLKAKVGFRIINANDGFGVCARGGVGYENDLFIMFRGTTTKYLGADIVSDTRKPH